MPRGRKKGEKNPERPIIQISDRYRIKLIDRYNYMLQKYDPTEKSEKEEDKNSTDGWKFFGYYTAWDGILWKLLKSEVARELSKKKRTELEELNTIFKKAKNEVIELGKNIKLQ